MGSSSQKRSRGLADGSEQGSGQRPEALRDFAIFTIDFHHCFQFFQLGKMSMIGNFCTQLFQSGTRVNPKQWRHKVRCLRLCVNLFSKNKYLFFLFLYGNSHWPSQYTPTLFQMRWWGWSSSLVLKNFMTVKNKSTSKYSTVLLCTSRQQCFQDWKAKNNGWLLSLVRLNIHLGN